MVLAAAIAAVAVIPWSPIPGLGPGIRGGGNSSCHPPEAGSASRQALRPATCRKKSEEAMHVRLRVAAILAVLVGLAAAAAVSKPAAGITCALPAGNAAQQWDQIAQDAV